MGLKSLILHSIMLIAGSTIGFFVMRALTSPKEEKEEKEDEIILTS